MGTPRQRQVTNSSGDGSSSSSKDRQESSRTRDERGAMPRRSASLRAIPRGRWTHLAGLIALAILILVYIGLARDARPLQFGNKAIDNIALSLSLHKQFHVVVIDAGSTASRVIAFTFHKSVVNGKLVLDDELFVETKPGLSAFAKRPQDARDSLELLLSKARERVPEADRARTPIVMRATAGLRLLPGHEAQDLLAVSRRTLLESGFHVADDAVEIMRGEDEGLFSWFSVNFLAKRFSGAPSAADTVAALDLGGGSTQLTFAMTPAELESLHDQHAKELKHVGAFRRNFTTFTRSFLGLGLMAARHAILLHPDDNNNNPPKNRDESPVELRSECVNPIVSKAEWSYGNVNYLVSGPLNGSHKIVKSSNFAGVDEDRPVVKFAKCLDIVRKVVNASIPRDLPKLVEHDIFAFSYYFERATEVGLIDPFEGGVVALEAFYKAADAACQDPNTDQPFICLDLSFIYVLLREGFGIDDATKIFLRKKIKGHELSWALGAAFNVLDPDS